jgi:hypothetical protein
MSPPLSSRDKKKFLVQHSRDKLKQMVRTLDQTTLATVLCGILDRHDADTVLLDSVIEQLTALNDVIAEHRFKKCHRCNQTFDPLDRHERSQLCTFHPGEVQFSATSEGVFTCCRRAWIGSEGCKQAWHMDADDWNLRKSDNNDGLNNDSAESTSASLRGSKESLTNNSSSSGANTVASTATAGNGNNGSLAKNVLRRSQSFMMSLFSAASNEPTVDDLTTYQNPLFRNARLPRRVSTISQQEQVVGGSPRRLRPVSTMIPGGVDHSYLPPMYRSSPDVSTLDSASSYSSSAKHDSAEASLDVSRRSSPAPSRRLTHKKSSGSLDLDHARAMAFARSLKLDD